MASLRDIARENADTIREGIAWLVVWKTGRSWAADYIYLNGNGSFEIDPDYIGKAIEIENEHHDAILVNGYYCGHLGETIEDIAAGIAWHYDRRAFQLTDYIVAYCANAEHVAQVRAEAEKLGIPFSSFPYTGETPDAYVYDGSMTPEDFETAQKCREIEAFLAERYPDANPDTIAAGVAKLVKESPELADVDKLRWALDVMERVTASVARIMDEVMPKLVEAFKCIADTFTSFANDAIPRLMAALAPYSDAELRKGCNSPKEWYLFKHAKKFRTRKKYMNRFIKRNARRTQAERGAT